MRCISCGAEMRVVQTDQHDNMMVAGYVQQRLECTGCHEVETRMVFDRSPALSPNEGGAGGRAQSVRSLRAKISGPSRFVRIHHDHGENAGYLAQDTKSGMVVLRYPDSERLREMCEWMGWQVTDDPVPSMDE